MRPVLRYLYGHRGASAEVPENTLASFRRALEVGAGAIELDVHVTGDGHVVVSHDPSGGRMAARPAPIATSAIEEVRGWDVGWGFLDEAGRRPWLGRGLRVPTLEEVLAELPGVRINVDVKPPSRAAATAVVDVVRRRRAQDRVLLTSFDDGVVRAIRAARYEGPTGLSRGEVRTLVLAPWLAGPLLSTRGRAVQIPVRSGRIALDGERQVARWHRLGLRVDYWVIDEPAEARRLLDLGADGIVTNDPRRLAPLFRDAVTAPAAR